MKVWVVQSTQDGWIYGIYNIYDNAVKRYEKLTADEDWRYNKKNKFWTYFGIVEVVLNKDEVFYCPSPDERRNY